MGPLSYDRPNIGRLILVPAIITLVITLLRLVGELQHWPTILFNPSAGGGGALVGITWLVPILGIYFAAKLASAGDRPSGIAKAIGIAVLGFILLIVGGAVGFGGENKSLTKYALGVCIMALAGAIQYFAWPTLFKVLLAYAYAARIPVAIIMFLAINGNWGTHYDVSAPGFPPMPVLRKFILIGLFPQLVLWIAFTLVVGLLLGAPTGAILGRKRGRNLNDAAAFSGT